MSKSTSRHAFFSGEVQGLNNNSQDPDLNQVILKDVSPEHTNYPPFPPPPQVTVTTKKLWQVWPGKNRFVCDGRVMVGPRADLPYVIGAVGTLSAVTLLYFIIIVPYLWIEVSVALPLLSGYLFISCIVFMTLSMTVDPGIIPRKQIFELSGYVPPEFTDNVLIMNPLTGVQYKYCSTCKIFRPPRSHHCNVCDNCVEVFDHHCPYLNNCIGKRNYRYFLGFVMSMVLHGVTSITGLFIFIFYDDSRDRTDHVVLLDDTAVLVVLIVLVVLTTILTVLIGILCVFHISLSLSGKTTKETLKKAESLKTNSKNCCRQRPSWFYKRMILTEQQIGTVANWPGRESQSS